MRHRLGRREVLRAGAHDSRGAFQAPPGRRGERQHPSRVAITTTQSDSTTRITVTTSTVTTTDTTFALAVVVVYQVNLRNGTAENHLSHSASTGVCLRHVLQAAVGGHAVNSHTKNIRHPARRRTASWVLLLGESGGAARGAWSRWSGRWCLSAVTLRSDGGARAGDPRLAWPCEL